MDTLIDGGNSLNGQSTGERLLVRFSTTKNWPAGDERLEMKIKNDTNMLTWIASFLCVEWCVHHSKMTLLDTSYLVGRVTMVSYHLKRQDNVFPRRHEQYTRHPTNGAGVVGRAGGKPRRASTTIQWCSLTWGRLVYLCIRRLKNISEVCRGAERGAECETLQAKKRQDDSYKVWN